MTSILIIDDSPEDREQFSNLLKQAASDVEVSCCYGGKDGLAAANERHFDCVLLDLRLDGEDGLDVLAELRETCSNLPVIVLTGQGNEQTTTAAFIAGAAFYLSKNDLTSKMLWTAVTRVTEQAETDRELRSVREAMERSNRLDAVGQLAAGIAHDFNNQLGALRYCIELLQDAVVTDQLKARAHTALQIIDESANLATRLVSLSRQGDLLAKTVALRDILADLDALALGSVSDQVVLEVGQPEAALTAFCDPGQLLNALLNLILNSVDAISDKSKVGTIKVTASREADTIRVVVKDNGKGMRDDVLAKCSNPFFTTKTDTKGTGLGLAMVQSFANESKGKLLIQSAEGVGTEMALILPVGREDEPSIQTDAPTSISQGEAVSILIVEDLFDLAMMTKDVLEKAGFTTEVVRDGTQALETIAYGFQPDVMLTDIKMPGMNGFALASKVQRIYPEIRVVYVTGYANNPEHIEKELCGPILQKPVHSDQLIATINKVLAGSAV